MTTLKVNLSEPYGTTRKRKYIENKLNEIKLLECDEPNNQILFTATSSNDEYKIYTIYISNDPNGVKLECTCGDQWGIIPRRNNCKHIGGIIANLMKVFVQNHKSNTSNHLTKYKRPKCLKSTNEVISKTSYIDNDISIDELTEKFKQLL